MDPDEITVAPHLEQNFAPCLSSAPQLLQVAAAMRHIQSKSCRQAHSHAGSSCISLAHSM